MKKVTLEHLSKELGVSKTLISFVINGQAKAKGISEKTTERVLKAVREMGYHPNNFARILRTGKSKTIGVIVPDISNPFYARICRHIENYAYNRGYHLVLCSSDENIEKENRYMKILYERGMDGVIVGSVQKVSENLVEYNKNNFPVVLIDRYFPKCSLNYIAIDNEKAAYEVTMELIKKNHERIAFFRMGPDHTSVARKRLAGYKRAFKESGLRIKSRLIKDFTFENVEENVAKEIREVMKENNGATAIISLNNKITVPALEYMKNNGIKVPEDISLISFDYLDVYRITDPPVNSVQLFAEKIGDKAAAMLFTKIDNPEASLDNVVIDAKYHERQSVRAL